MELNKSEKSILKHISSLKAVSTIITLFGLVGFFLGLFSIFFREMSSDARPLNFSLIVYSIGVFFLGYLLRQACAIIEKLKRENET